MRHPAIVLAAMRALGMDRLLRDSVAQNPHARGRVKLRRPGKRGEPGTGRVRVFGGPRVGRR